MTVRLVAVTERGDQGWAAPDRPQVGAGPPAYASDWPQAPAGRPPLPAPPVRRPSPPPPLRITLPPNLAPPPPARPLSPPGAPGFAAPPFGAPQVQSWPGALRQPGGLIPTGPPRPIYREPGPARPGPVAAGAGAAALWLLLFGLLATTARSYVWLTFVAGAVAWISALVLARLGDRGVAIGVALSTSVGVAIAGIVITVQWSAGHWLLW